MRSLLLKRAVDLTGAVTLAVLAGPVMLGIAVAILLRLGRPVLFTQQRAGRRGRPFRLYKFRTMREAIGPDGNPLPDAQRTTRLGRWLRRKSLDELPQLLNVLGGSMSLVGPRPLPVRYVQRYTPEQARRLLVKPGLTGWGQVNGRNSPSWEEKHALDAWYADHWNLWLDLRICGMTFLKVFRSDGIDHAEDVTMPEFTGSPNRRGA